MTEESKSISQSDLLSAYDEKCPHCALTRFANLWQDYQNTDTQELLEGLLELLADVVVTIPNEELRRRVATAVAVRLTRDLTSILAGKYKPDQLAALHANENGGLH